MFVCCTAPLPVDDLVVFIGKENLRMTQRLFSSLIISIKYALIFFMGIVMFPNTAALGENYNNVDSFEAIVQIAPEEDVQSNKLEIWLDKLADKESGHQADIVVVDVNGKKSYGCFQFQMATWIGMGEKYGFITTPDNILDCSLQKQVAFSMIDSRYENWKHWRCSVVGCDKYNIVGIGLPPSGMLY